MKLMEMTVEELVLYCELLKLANEAKSAAELIKSRYSSGFGIDQREIHIYRKEAFGDCCRDMYLSIDGILRYEENCGAGRKYEFACDAEGIYKMLRSSYLRNKKLEHLDPENHNCPIENMERVFRDFISVLWAKTSME